MKGGLKDYLAERLNPQELKLLYSSYDIVGDIAIIRVPQNLKHRTEEIAKAIMHINNHIKTVLYQSSPVLGDLRLRELRWVAGEKKTETIHREHGCFFKVDLDRCYFSPRLLYERERIAKKVKPGEVIVNMFSGVGCYSIIIAKHSQARKVYSIDINPAAIEYQKENVRLNKVENIVEPILGDAKEVINERLRNIADRVLMPLPEKAYDYLDFAVMALKPGKGTIHYYGFTHAKKDENPIRKVKEKVSKKLNSLNLDFNISFGKVVRTVGPRWFQIVLDTSVHKNLNRSRQF